MAGEQFPGWDDLHPVAKGAFMALADDLHMGWSKGVIPVWFRPFELLRTPERQRTLRKEGKSRAGPWESAHQFGLAVDYVPYVRGKWSWAVNRSDWDHLRRLAHARGLLNDIEWDRAHVEHPAFGAVRTALARPQPPLAPVRSNAATESERP